MTNEQAKNQDKNHKPVKGTITENFANTDQIVSTDQPSKPAATSGIARVPAPGKRRGLTLPPRGQALSRLQDLEQDAPTSAEHSASLEGTSLGSTLDISSTKSDDIENKASSNAVSTASSNAVTEDSTAIKIADMSEPIDLAALPANSAAQSLPPVMPEVRARAAREPTTRITVDMPDSLHKRLSFLSVETRRSIKDLVIEALDVAYFQAERKD